MPISDDLIFDPESHIYSLKGRRLPSVTQIIKAVGIVDDRFFTDHGRIRGTAVHTACQYYDEGDLNEEDLDPALRPYLDAWVKFREEFSLIPDLIEKRYCSVLGFAGTLDRQSGNEIIDIKTGVAQWYTGIQLAAYKILHEENGGGIIRVRRAVFLKEDGTYSVKKYINRDDRKVFLGALACVNARINNNSFWGR